MNEQEIFVQVLGRADPADRLAYLDRSCNGNAQLRQRVEILLRAHEGAGRFLESPAAGSVATIDHAPLAEKPGTIIGPYKLLQQIGEGGMGVVYMADQEQPVRRRVALKIIKPGMDSRQVIARFEAERQALAMMDHQNIARVLDAGTTESGRPYFVMELVHGVPLTKFCDDNRLTPRQRLELFVPVCHAIQHAHQKGVIHRDIKPSNILVTMYDDKPVPKVIDFGVAKAVEQRLTEKTLFTQYGMLVGTFEYMSPEQAEMNAYGVDTRSDIYSLGVLLYELLTGTTPLERPRVREAALVELVRLIKEEEPPRPSIRLSSTSTLPKFAAACRTEPARLSQLLRGELDWIVMKCLEKDRSRRYETANGLGRDVQRYLNDEPVEACPPSLAYRFRKLAGKHRGLLTTAAAFAALLMVGVIVSAWLAVMAIRAQRLTETALASERIARQQAVAAKEEADRISQRLSQATQITSDGIEYYTRSNWSAAHDHFTRAMQTEPGLNTPYIYRGTLYTCLGLWDKAAADYDRRFQLANRANAQTWFDYALLKAYTGDDAGYRDACQEMLRQHQSAAEMKSKFYVVRSCLLTSRPAGDSGDLVHRAESLVAAANVPWHFGTAGRAYLLAGEFKTAEARCREAIKLGTGSPAGVHRVNYPNLALALFRQGKTGEASDALSRAEQARDQWTKSMHDGLVGAMPVSWGDWLEFELFYREAKTLLSGSPPVADPRLTAIYDRALATVTHGDTFTAMDAGREHVRRKAWDQAAIEFAQVLENLPPGFRNYTHRMRFCIEMVQSPEVFDRLASVRPNDQHLWAARGRLYASSGQWAKAVADYEKCLDLLTQEFKFDAASELGPLQGIAADKHELATLLVLSGESTKYRELCQSIVDHPLQVNDSFLPSELSRACTLTPDALSDWSVPLDLARQAVAKQPRVAWYLFALGIAQHRAGQQDEAIKSLNRSLAVDPAWVGRGQNYAVLSLACHSLGREAEAREWLDKTKSWLNETNRAAAGWRFGYAATAYMSDWLGAQILLAEAERLLASGQSP